MKKIPAIISVLIFLLASCENETQKTENDNIVFDNLTQQENNTNKQTENIEFKASSENIVEKGEIFSIKYEVNAEPESFSPPDFEGLDVISGPATSSFSSIQIINGKSSRKYTNSYTYSVSCPEAGIITVKPAEITIKGKTYKSNSLTIKVIGNETNTTENKKKNKINTEKDIFIRTELSKSTVYNGEFITATTKIYTRKDFQNISEIKFPDYSGFWTKSLKEPRRIEFHNELINGKKYSVALLKQILLFAVKPGKYEISPYEISLQIRKKDGKTRDFFGNITDSYKIINKNLKTKKKIIIVKPLPEPQPENFSGFTGKNVSVNAYIDTQDFETEESAVLKITVSGTGNLYMLNNFNLNLPEGLKTFKPETELKDKYTENGETGDRIFIFTVVAEQAGSYEIPTQKFVYFDSDKQKYDTAYTNPIKINVTGEKTNSHGKQKTRKTYGKDIRYIKTDIEKLEKQKSKFTDSALYYALYPILIFILSIILYLRKRRIKENENIEKIKKKNAGKVSQKRLKNAYDYLKKQDKNGFYKEILKAVWGYLSDKMSVNADELTEEGIKEMLNKKNVNKKLQEKLLNIINICGYAQYAPAGEEAEPEKIYKETENLINELEKTL